MDNEFRQFDEQLIYVVFDKNNEIIGWMPTEQEADDYCIKNVDCMYFCSMLKNVKKKFNQLIYTK